MHTLHFEVYSGEFNEYMYQTMLHLPNISACNVMIATADSCVLLLTQTLIGHSTKFNVQFKKISLHKPLTGLLHYF